MRYSTVFKFIAFVLCAATLVGIVGSAAGILFLTELGGKSVEEAYQDQLRNQSIGYAMEAGGIYASEVLGSAHKNLINYYFANDWQNRYFDWTRVGYSLIDSEGNVVQEVELPASGQPIVFEEEIPVGGRYMKVIATTPRKEYQTAPGNTDHGVQVWVMPSQPRTVIGGVLVDYTDGHHEEWNPGNSEQVGLLYYDGGSSLRFQSNFGEIPAGDGWYPNHIILLDMGGNVVYEAAADSYVIAGSSLNADGVHEIYLPAGTVTVAAPVGTTVTNTDVDYKAYDAIPAQGVTATAMTVTYANAQGKTIGSEGISSPDLIGTMFHMADGNAEFRSTEPMTMDIPENSIITGVTFLDVQNNVLFEANCPKGVGTIEYDNNGYLIFKGGIPRTEQSEETAVGAAEKEATESAEGQTGFTTEIVVLYSAPSQLSKELGSLDAWEEITILRQDSFNGESWGLTAAGWVRMNKVLLAENTAGMAENYVPEETAVTEVPAETQTVAEFAEAPKLRTVPENTEPTAAEATGETVSAAEAAMYPPEAVEVGYYYDHEQKQEMAAQYVWETIPYGYTMKIKLAQGALRNELGWTLLRVAEVFRNILLEALGVCIAVFALCVVHLCCSAGRTRRNNEVRAGGLNRIPLDLYALGGGGSIVGLMALAMIGSQHFARNDEQLALIVLGACAYLACLVLVGLFFAFVAQIKTPHGYWWRNSLCGRCLKLVAALWRWLIGKGKLFWRNGLPMTGTLLVWLWNGSKKAFFWFLDTGKRIGRWLFLQVKQAFFWLTARLVRFFALLPITWQFLLTGFTLVFLLYVVLRSYKVGWILLGFGLFFATILYAASAFAILLDSAKRMSKGDLDTKVDDKMLIGGFRDFAGELNDLADVAVVAAQKQLKSERMKTELITNVSHDIKTPLTSIINYVDLLQKPHTEEEQTQYLEVLDRQSQRLKKLIDDLMEMSKASTGNMTVEIDRVDAGEAVNQALGEFADKLERAQLTPVFRQPEEQIYMMADGRLVWRVMSNLLGNAVKYALPGTRIYLDLMAVEGKVIISMKNISREELNVHADELLERFVRGDASRNTEGSGLGLNIAQSLMELQKGQLQILVDGDLFKVTLIFPGV